MAFRTEQDALGKKNIPKNALYGINTLRSHETFNITGKTLPVEVFQAIAELKVACAHANKELGSLSKKKWKAIVKAGEEVADGKWNNQFLIDAFQSGAGTPTHMNVNEVIANRAIELLNGKKGDHKVIDPHNDVNMGQSTNNVIPSMLKLVSASKIEDLLKILAILERSLKKKSKEFNNILKTGRTHLMDAVPVTLGQEFHAYSTSISQNIKRLKEVRSVVYVLNIGKNAIGTGINTYPQYTKLIVKHLKKRAKYPWKVAKDGIYSTNNLSVFLEVSQKLQLLAVDLGKMANDLRLLNSGPNTGIREIKLPATEPGSSIMPGKVNPNICEMLNMVCFQIIGNNETISLAVQAGQLELNVMMPVISRNLIESFDIATNAVDTFENFCIKGIKANKEECRKNFEINASIATLLNPYIGYDKAAEVVKESVKTGKSIKEIVISKGLLSKSKLDKIFDYKRVTSPNLVKKKSTRK